MTPATGTATRSDMRSSWPTIASAVLVFSSFAGRAWYESHPAMPIWLLITFPVVSVLGIALADRGAGRPSFRIVLAALGGIATLMWITAWLGMGPTSRS